MHILLYPTLSIDLSLDIVGRSALKKPGELGVVLRVSHPVWLGKVETTKVVVKRDDNGKLHVSCCILVAFLAKLDEWVVNGIFHGNLYYVLLDWALVIRDNS